MIQSTPILVVFPLALGTPQVVLLALTTAAVAVLLRRTFRSRMKRIPLAPRPAPREPLPVAAPARSHFDDLEVRLYDFSREIESRTQSRVSTLDRLVVEADREIARLQSILSDVRGLDKSSPSALKPGPDFVNSPRSSAPSMSSGLAPTRTLTNEQRLMIVYLGDAGHSAESIAELVHQPVETIRPLLADWQRDDRADAA